MRTWIALFESQSPNWFQAGEIIDINDPKWDAAEFLNPPEFELEWRYCFVPSSIVQPNLLDPEESNKRIHDINQWLDGDISKIEQEPPVAIWNGTEMFILDGNHRAHVALESGAIKVPMLIAIDQQFSETQFAAGESDFYED